MYAIKIFDLSDSVKDVDVERIINLWFAAHPHLEFANVSVGFGENNKIRHIITYKIKNLEQ
jgi:hypothetical protein